MADVRIPQPTTDWIEFRLQTRLLDPPVLRVKLRPVSPMDSVDLYADGARKLSDLALGQAINAIVAWDLSRDGVEIVCSDATKSELDFYLRILLAQPLEAVGAEDEPKYLGLDILRIAGDTETFLKNS